MLILILSLLHSALALAPPSAAPRPVASASPKPTPRVYSRIYLRGMQRLENERIQSEYISKGITYIEESVFTAAKQGLVKFTTEPFLGCDFYKSPSVVEDGIIDKTVCENILNGIHTLVSERFPDSTVIYDAATKRYTLKWD